VATAGFSRILPIVSILRAFSFFLYLRGPRFPVLKVRKPGDREPLRPPLSFSGVASLFFSSASSSCLGLVPLSVEMSRVLLGLGHSPWADFFSPDRSPQSGSFFFPLQPFLFLPSATFASLLVGWFGRGIGCRSLTREDVLEFWCLFSWCPFFSCQVLLRRALPFASNLSSLSTPQVPKEGAPPPRKVVFIRSVISSSLPWSSQAYFCGLFSRGRDFFPTL